MIVRVPTPLPLSFALRATDDPPSPFSRGRMRQRRSVRPDVGVLDHLAPLAELDLDEVAELAGRRGKALEADILEFRLDLRAVDDRAQRGVELGHDIGRHAGRCNEAGPGVEFEAFDA